MPQQGACKYIKGKDIIDNKSMSKERGTQIVALITLCLMSMDFQTRFFYFAFLLFGVLLIIQRMEFEIPQAFIPAFILSVSMCLFSNSTRGWALAMIRPFAYPLCVIVGFNLINSESKKKAEIQIVAIIVSLALGAYIHYILNMIYNWGRSVDRNTVDYWTKSVLAATGQSTLASLMIGVSIPLLFSEIRKRYKILLSFILISILYYNLMLGGRTVFVLFIILFIVNISAQWIRNKTYQTRIKIIVTLICTTIILFTIIHYNIFGIQDIFFRSNFFYRFFVESDGTGFTEDGRMTYKLLFLKNMIYYPLGGNELHRAAGNHYAHDLLLDTYSDSSIFAFGALVIMLAYYLVRTIRIYKQTDNIMFKNVILNSMIVFFIIFAMEPIFDGMPWLFASYCIVYGSIARINTITDIKQRGYINAYCRN